MAGRPLVLAHRGASAVAPENTLAAFSKARELGADGVELDVRRSADDVLIVHHDPAIEGLGPLAQLTFDRLRAARPTVPTFAEALHACAGMVVNVEVKCLPWEIDADPEGFVVRATLDALAGRDGTFIVTSFDLGAVVLARAHAPDVVTGWLTHGREVEDGARIASEHGHRWLNPDAAAARDAGPDGIGAAHAAGVLVGTWTVDDPKAAGALAAAGVDIIISNVPDLILRELDGGSRS